jgi:hypothetical protein
MFTVLPTATKTKLTAELIIPPKSVPSWRFYKGIVPRRNTAAMLIAPATAMQ